MDNKKAINPKTEKLLNDYINSFHDIINELSALQYYVKETIRGLKHDKEHNTYDGGFIRSPDNLSGHAFRILSHIQRVNDIYQNDGSEWGEEDD